MDCFRGCPAKEKAEMFVLWFYGGKVFGFFGQIWYNVANEALKEVNYVTGHQRQLAVREQKAL